MKIYLLVFCGLILPAVGGLDASPLFAEDVTPDQGQNIQLPEDGFAPGWYQTESARHFAAHNLYGYINGGAELFLEFGFDELIVQKYSAGERTLELEIYQLENPTAALGIYLYRRGKLPSFAEIDARNSGNRYQIAIAKGNYYLQINNFSGDTTTLPTMISLAQQVSDSLPAGETVSLFDLLPRDNLMTGSEKIIRGPYALQPIYTLGEGDMLSLGGKVFGVLGDYQKDSNEVITRIVIPYPGREPAQTAYEYLKNNLDPELIVRDKWTSGFTFVDWQKKYGLMELIDTLLMIEINYLTPPLAAERRYH